MTPWEWGTCVVIVGFLTTAPLNAETLVISGVREASYVSEQAGLDCVTLPSLRKALSGHYSARNFDWSLEQILYCRSRIISTTIECFQPDVLIVDKVPAESALSLAQCGSRSARLEVLTACLGSATSWMTRILRSRNGAVSAATKQRVTTMTTSGLMPIPPSSTASQHTTSCSK